MFQIHPNSSKSIIYIKYYSAVPISEYGLIRIKTLNDMIIIPVLINIIISPIITTPKIFNFGLCQIGTKSKYNVKKIKISRFILQRYEIIHKATHIIRIYFLLLHRETKDTPFSGCFKHCAEHGTVETNRRGGHGQSYLCSYREGR